MSAGSNLPAMSNAAFAGFLRLLLTPLNEDPRPSSELGAYLEYVSGIHPPGERHSEHHIRPREARVTRRFAAPAP